MSWTNADGLKVKFGLELSDGYNHGLTSATPKIITMDLDPVNKALPLAADVDQAHPSIPAGAYITKASLVVTEAFTSAGVTTLDIGLCQVDGTVIDLDGIDAVIAKAALAADLAVACNGALVGGTATVGATDAYLYFTTSIGPYTAGKARLVIEYVEV